MAYSPDDNSRVVLGGLILTKELKEDGTVTYTEQMIGHELHSIELLGMIESARDTIKGNITGRARPAA